MRNLTCSIVSLTILSLLFYSCLSSRAQNSLVESRESESPIIMITRIVTWNYYLITTLLLLKSLLLALQVLNKDLFNSELTFYHIFQIEAE